MPDSALRHRHPVLPFLRLALNAHVNASSQCHFDEAYLNILHVWNFACCKIPCTASYLVIIS